MRKPLQTSQAVSLTVDELAVVPVGEPLALAEEGFETGACVLGNIAVHDSLKAHVVNVARDGGELLGCMFGVDWKAGTIGGIAMGMVVVADDESE